MRKVKESVLEGKKISIGLEDSKRTWRLCIRCDGMIVHELSMPADYASLHSYLSTRFPKCQITVMYEAGFRGFWLHDFLVGDGFRCVVVPPNKVVEEKCNRIKTDTTDARRLAKNLENGDYRSCHVPEKERREMRQYSRTLGQIQAKIVATKNQVRRTLEFHGLDSGFPAGRWGDSDYARLRTLPLSEPLKVIVDIYLTLLDQLRTHRKALLAKLKELCNHASFSWAVKCYSSFPGIGTFTAIRLALEWGDLSRFNRKEDFASYLGLVPSENSSGAQEQKGHITAQGNRFVRSWLIEAAWIAIRKDPILLEKFRNICTRTTSKKKAVVAVARKMALRMRSLYLMNQTYAIGTIA